MAGRSLGERPTFRLTRVTRIFQKSVFTETTQPPGRDAAPGFLLRARKPRPRQAGFSCLQKNREIQEITAMPFQKGESDDVPRPPPYPWTRAARCTPPVAKTSGHCFATVLYNENTNHDV
jgi:hypothetical protein